jgi:integrase
VRGHVLKRGNSYSIVISLGKDTVTGKYKYQWVTVKGTKKDAERRLAELLHQIDNGIFIKPGKTSLAEYLERWLRDYAWPSLAPRTAEGYEHIVRRHLIPALGNTSLAKLKPEHLQKYYAQKLSENLSAQTIRHHHTTMHKALQTAFEWGLLSRNPADAVRPPLNQRVEMQTWNEDEIGRFLDIARNSPYYALFYTALFTGLRRSELLALRWLDVDLILCQIHVSRSLHVLKGGKIVIRSPKTAKGRRMVALSPSTALVLSELKEGQKLERAMQGIPLKDDELVFSWSDGNPMLPNSITHAWIRLVRKAGIKAIRLHDARHTHASLMLKQGAHPKVVQERLGHASIQVTLDTYSHVAPGLQDTAARRFDEAFKVKYNGHANELAEKHY